MQKVIVNTRSMRKKSSLRQFCNRLDPTGKDPSNTALLGFSNYELGIFPRVSPWYHTSCLHAQNGTGHFSLSLILPPPPSFPFYVNNITIFPDSQKQISFQFLHLPCLPHSIRPHASTTERTLVCTLQTNAVISSFFLLPASLFHLLSVSYTIPANLPLNVTGL